MAAKQKKAGKDGGGDTPPVDGGSDRSSRNQHDDADGGSDGGD
jgi:hypothetical protein